MSKPTAGVLQTSLDELHSTNTAGPAVASAGQHQDIIRGLLREQKRECVAIHANPLFKEFRDRQRRMKSSVQDAAPPPVIDDLEAEGQARLLDVIRAAAADRQSEPAGVWASFGKPYQCLGELQQLEGCIVPQLNRDELQQQQGSNSSQQQRRSQQQQQRAAGQAAAAGSFVAAAGGAAKKAARALASQRQSSEGSSGPPGGGSREAEEAAHLLRHKTVMQFSTVDRLEAAFPAAAVKQANARRKAAKSHPHTFFNKTRAAADAADPSASYGRHQLPFKPLPALDLVQHHQAAAAAAAAAAVSATHTGQSAARTTAAAGGCCLAADRGSVFITQRAAAGAPSCAVDAVDGAAGATHNKQCRCRSGSVIGAAHQVVVVTSAGDAMADGEGPAAAVNAGNSSKGASSKSSSKAPPPANKRSSVAGHTPAAASSRHRSLGPAAAAAAARSSVSASTADSQLLSGVAEEISSALCCSISSTSAASSHHTKQEGCAEHQQQQQQQQPAFKPLTELVLQAPGTSSSPVTDWHNDFVKVRHAGYTSLQASLWQRSEGRAAARSEPAAAGELQRGLMRQLDAVTGRLAPGWTPGVVPCSPFAAGSKQRSSAAAAAAESACSGGARTIKKSEVELLEHFYDALCGLVERQRLSDPLSLLVVHKVKALLESGTFLQPVLLQQVIEGVAEFATSCGLLRHNRFALPLLTFVSKCVGVSQQEFRGMVAAAGITEVLYEASSAASEQQLPACDPADGCSRVAAAGCGEAGTDAATAAGPAAAGAEQQMAAGGGPASFSRCSTRGRGSLREPPGGSSSSGQRIASAAGSAAAAAAAAAAEAAALPVPAIPIEAAAAAAAADLDQAVRSAPASHRSVKHAGAKSVRVRVQGVAGHIELPGQQQQLSPSAAAACTRPDSSSGGGGTMNNNASAGVGEDDEPLPELGLDEAGQPLSRRLRHEEGLQNWSQPAGGAGGSPEGAANMTDEAAGHEGTAEHDSDQERD